MMDNISSKAEQDQKKREKSDNETPEIPASNDTYKGSGRIHRANYAFHRHPPPASPDEVVLAAAAIAITLCRHKTIDEIQTLFNLFSTTSGLIDSILKQRLINKAFEEPVLSVELD